MTITAAVDYGRKRIGLAVSDPLGITARGLPTVPGDPDANVTVERIAAALEAEGVERIVVGLPLHSTGEESDMSREVRAFGAVLEARVGIPIDYLDEGFSSQDAERLLLERGEDLIEARKSGLIDRESARLILLAWLRSR